MTTKRYGVSEVVQLVAGLAKPIAAAWQAEGGPTWWAQAKTRAAGWLRRVADRLAPTNATVTVTISATIPAPAPAPIAKPIRKPAKPRKATLAKAKPAPKAKPKPISAAARVTKPKATPKPKAWTASPSTGT
jgi:outer membrane biosynthesis protein TonB